MNLLLYRLLDGLIRAWIIFCSAVIGFGVMMLFLFLCLNLLEGKAYVDAGAAYMVLLGGIGVFIVVFYICLFVFRRIYDSFTVALKESKTFAIRVNAFAPYEFKITPTPCVCCGKPVFTVSLHPKAVGVCKRCIRTGRLKLDA